MAISTSSRRSPALAAALSLIAAQTALGATNTARVALNPNFSGGNGPIDLLVHNPGPVDAAAATTGGANSFGDAKTHVLYGFVQIQAHSTGSLSAQGIGSFQDTITITAPGVPNSTPGTLTYSVRVDGAISATAGASGASWSVATDIGGGATDLSRGGHISSPDLSPLGYQGDAFGTYTATGDFQFGFPATITVELHGIAGTGYSQNGEGLASVPSLRVFWNGISAINLNGAPISNFIIVSGSGFNWLGSFTPCAGDLNGDGQVDDSDFVSFVVAYNILDCADLAMPAGCPADFNSDGVVDDFDFVSFVVAYNELVCP
ncbi:MAG: hypothetical protein ACREJD_10365 [Phycisphaerales bacterium]